MLVIAYMVGSINRKTMVQARLGKKQHLISRITRAKSAGGMAQAVEYLPSKYKVLTSKPSTAKKKCCLESLSCRWLYCAKIKICSNHLTVKKLIHR
jgi:hypothetical protein